MASSIVTSAAKQLGTLVVGEAKFLYDVSDKIERLQRDLEWMQCFLEDADDRQHKQRVVAKWVAEIRDFAYEAEEIVEKYLHGVSHHRQNGIRNTIKWLSCVMCDALALHDVGSNIDSLSARISELTSRMQMFGVKMTSQSESLTSNIAMREQRRTYAHIEENPVGLEENVKEVVDKLLNNNEVAIIGISGMGGLGKSTLARGVFQNEDVRRYFKKNCVWVYLSKQFERKDIFREILIGLENTDKDVEKTKNGDGEKTKKNKELVADGDLPREICKMLAEKECLVVLDDIWRNGQWDILKLAFEGIKSSGSKILITTRDKGVIQYANGYPYILPLLSEDKSWELFQRTAFANRENIENKEEAGSQDSTTKSVTTEEIVTNEDVKAKKEKLGREILKHCNGLPLAIKALGGILSTKRSVAEWENVQKNIAFYLSDMVEGISDSRQGVSSVLELSYSDLPFYLKPCFMYLGIFPEDYKISAQRLYHLWEAEGLVTTLTYSGDEILGGRLDDIAESFLNQLVNRSMVQVDESWSNGRIKSCRLHDMMRDLCLKKCKEVNFVNIIEQGGLEEPTNQIASLSTTRKLRRCALYLRGPGSVIDTALENNNSPCIRSVVVFPQGHRQARKILSGEAPQKALSLVRVLDLQGTDIEGSRPVKFGNFIHLRYLSIKGTRVGHLPSCIWDCKYLETLDLRVFVYMKLSNKLWKLERLRHLYLPQIMELMGSKKKLIVKNNQLQQMETFKNFDVKVCKIEDLEKMTNMRVFTLSECSYLDGGSLKCLLESPMMTAKRIVKPMRLQIQAGVINEDPTMLTTRGADLCIDGIGIRDRIDVELDGSVEIFPNSLASVKLDGCEIGEQGIRILEKLPLLKKLELSWESIKVSKMSFSKGGFTQLVKLFLLFLDTLEELEVKEGALPNLRYLDIYKCKRLKMIPEGLPSSIQIECYPCVKGIEFYKTCSNFTQSD